MSRKKMTWFGFSLTQKQSITLFILSIAGLFISVFLFMTMLYPLIMNIVYYDPYYPDDYFIVILFSMLPYMIVSCGVFVISLYSLIRCKKIAKYLSPSIDPVIEQKPKFSHTDVPPKSIGQFCSNCGEMKKGHEKFCTNCGHQASY
ncbi:MAG: hypothetical protein ACTSQU_07815 [Promethearchaeota archaeon]